MNLKYICKILLFLLFLPGQIYSQGGDVIDEIISVVGDSYVLRSELEMQYVQYAAQSSMIDEETIKCQILDQLLTQKLFLAQAKIDSVVVSEDMVNNELDRRLQYFAAQLGSEEKLEEYYGKSIIELKEEFRPSIKEQLLIQKIQSRITKDVKVTPSEIKKFFKSIPSDSLPFINAEVELSQIVRYPKLDAASRKKTMDELDDIRHQILAGKEFATMASIHSQDPASAQRGGELGFVNRGELVPEFEAVAYKLENDDISDVFQTQFGFHIAQLIERRGESINVRHILIKPQFTSADKNKVKALLDSIRTLIQIDTMTFEAASRKISDDENTKKNGGVVINAETGMSKIPMDKLEPSLFFQIDTLKPGRISAPLPMKSSAGVDGYRLIYFKSKTPPHRANLKDDYQQIQNAANSNKEQKAYEKWFEKKRKTTYIQVDDQYKNCDAVQKWMN